MNSSFISGSIAPIFMLLVIVNVMVAIGIIVMMIMPTPSKFQLFELAGSVMIVTPIDLPDDMQVDEGLADHDLEYHPGHLVDEELCHITSGC